MILVFLHLLAAAMALGAIVATDLRLLAKLSQDRVRIAPPNAFVARIVMLALGLLYLTGAGIVWQELQVRPDYLDNPKLQAKLLMVVLLTLNAFVLHRITFPRLSRGRRVARWHAADWVAVAVPVALSNFLWMFVAFLGIARPWNDTMPLRDILEIAAGLYVVAQLGVVAILAVAGSQIEPERRRLVHLLKQALAQVGNLGSAPEAPPPSRGRSRSRSRRPSPAAGEEGSAVGSSGTALPSTAFAAGGDGVPAFAQGMRSGTLSPRPALRLVDGVGPVGVAVSRRQVS